MIGKTVISLIFTMLFLASSGHSADGDAVTVVTQQYDWNKGKIANVKQLPAPQFPKSDLNIPLTVIKNIDSSWKDEEIHFLIHEAQKVFKQCEKFGINVSLNPISYFQLNHKRLNYLHYRDDYLFTQDLPDNIVKLVTIFTQRNFYTGGGYANMAEVLDDEKKKISYGTAFIVNGIKSFRPDDGYSYNTILAHELAHIILEEGQVDLVGNLMNHEDGKGGYLLTREQCLKIEANKLVKAHN